MRKRSNRKPDHESTRFNAFGLCSSRNLKAGLSASRQLDDRHDINIFCSFSEAKIVVSWLVEPPDRPFAGTLTEGTLNRTGTSIETVKTSWSGDPGSRLFVQILRRIAPFFIAAFC